MKVVGVENCLVIFFKTIFCYQKQEKQGKQEKKRLVLSFLLF